MTRRGSMSRTRGAWIGKLTVCSALTFFVAFSEEPVDAGTRNVCAVVSAGQATSWVGRPLAVSPYQMFPPSIACSWWAPDHHGGMLSINVVPARQADPPPHGSATLVGFGPKAYTFKDGKSFRAAAPKGGEIVHVMVEGPKATRDLAVTILKAVLPKV